MWTVRELKNEDEISETKLKSIIEGLKENHQIELKGSSQLPASLWESCSSFANTSSGNIFLGVKEGTEKNEITGVSNPNKTLTDLWNGMSNRNKISIRVIDNEDVAVRKVDGKSVILITVREAELRDKPVYLNGKLENTYIRTGDGDRKATNDEIAALFRNTVLDADTQILHRFSLEDLDSDSLTRFKTIAASRYPTQNLLTLSDEDFLIRLGAARRDRETGEFLLYKGTILFIGKTNVIREIFPHFHLDYFEYRKGSDKRWNFRISDDDYLNGEINLLAFFNRVRDRLAAYADESFSLDETMMRKPEGGLTDIALREALVNTLVHADYEMTDGAVRIEARPEQYAFSNPGSMLIQTDDFFSGGISRPRNELLMKLFRTIGYAERQGFGGNQIYESSKARDYKLPEVSSTLSRTDLTIWTEESTALDPSLTDEEKSVLTVFKSQIHKEPLSFSSIHHASGLTEYYTRKALRSLTEKNYLKKTGKGRGMTYIYIS